MYLINLKLNNSMKKSILLLFFVLLALPFVFADIPTFALNEDIFISKTARLNGAISPSISCNITIRDPNQVTRVPLTTMFFNTTSAQHEIFIDGKNNSIVGIYTYTRTCSNGPLNETVNEAYEINPSGKAYIPQISGPLIFGAILTLMFISFFLLVVGLKLDVFPLKVFFVILSGIVAIMNIGFVAGSFQEFFSTGSSLSGAFGTLYIAFIMMLTAASVFLMIWVLLVGFKMYKVKRGFFVEP